MSKAFDIAFKHLIGDFASDWAAWLAPHVGLPSTVDVAPLDVDLSTVQVVADKVFQLQPPAVGLLHIEAQASWDGDLPDRMLTYGTLLHDRYGGPIDSVALLLRREANASSLTGVLRRTLTDGREYLRFTYHVVRVWELSATELLSGGFGAMPLALLTDEASGQLEDVVLRMDERMQAEKLNEATRKLVLTSGFILLGMRYDEAIIQSAFRKVMAMKESVSYQAILREGRIEGLNLGRQEGLSQGLSQGLSHGLSQGLSHGLLAARQEDLIEILRERFGSCPVELIQRIQTMQNVETLKAAIRAAVRVASPDELAL